jgi:hypothetical protein
MQTHWSLSKRGYPSQCQLHDWADSLVWLLVKAMQHGEGAVLRSFKEGRFTAQQLLYR